LAGTIGRDFYSFRIDRMIEDGDSVLFLDYKTDREKNRRDEYVDKMKKYAFLLRKIYPGKTIRGFILWLHDFELEEV
jgi:ATP-dependent exoDNAse (exonuclease V) beta subunit